MTTSEQRLRMASTIVNFEARRDTAGRLKVYELPAGDGGGRYEVAGINERYNKSVADALVSLIEQRKFAEAESLAIDFVAEDTDRASAWTGVSAVEFYLRDCVFNRGGSGAARIFQRALGVNDDAVVGARTRAAARAHEGDVLGLLAKLRAAREDYERSVVGRDETSKFWRGLVSRWDKALAAAKTFPMSALPLSVPTVEPAPAGVSALSGLGDRHGPILPALRVGSAGPRVSAWQSFLRGQGLDIGVIDGDFGEHTRNATAAFQKKVKVTADGVAGRETILKAATMGFELIEEPTDATTSSNFPPRPSFSPIRSNSQRQALFGKYEYLPAPQPGNREAIRILETWEDDNIVSVPIPQLRKALGTKAPQTMRFHRSAADQLRGVWSSWDKAGLLDRVLTFDGSFNARFVRGSRSTLSNHAFGSAFDINEPYNKLGHRPALIGEKGCVRELVEIANQCGFWWGGHFDTRKDGMHFEVAFLK